MNTICCVECTFQHRPHRKVLNKKMRFKRKGGAVQRVVAPTPYKCPTNFVGQCQFSKVLKPRGKESKQQKNKKEETKRTQKKPTYNLPFIMAQLAVAGLTLIKDQLIHGGPICVRIASQMSLKRVYPRCPFIFSFQSQIGPSLTKVD